MKWLIVLSLIINCLTTYLIYSLYQENKTLIANKESHKIYQESGTDIEHLAFLNDFLQLWFTWNSENFTENQARIINWLDPELQKFRRKEIDNLKEKIKKQNVVQTAKVIAIEEAKTINSDSWIQTTAWLKVTVKTSEKIMNIEKSKDQIKDHNIQLLLKVSFQSKPKEKSSENIWGQMIRNFSMKVVDHPPDFKTISMAFNHLTQLSIPCPVSSIDNSGNTNVQIHLNVGDPSVIDLKLEQNINYKNSVRFYCGKNFFQLELAYSPDEKKQSKLIFFALPSDMMETPRLAPPKPVKKEFENPLWKELGFEVDTRTKNSH